MFNVLYYKIIKVKLGLQSTMSQLTGYQSTLHLPLAWVSCTVQSFRQSQLPPGASLTDKTMFPQTLAANIPHTFREHSANTLPRTLRKHFKMFAIGMQIRFAANTLPRILRKHCAANTPQTHLKIFSVPYADIMNSTYFIYNVYIAVHKDIKTLIFLKHIL